MTEELLNGAEIEGPYRYRLWRNIPEANVVGSGIHSVKTVLWIMLNPSTADATENDPTIRKVMGFSMRWGFKQARIVNLCALRSTDPKGLITSTIDPVGPKNFQVIEEELNSAYRVVLAWGANAKPNCKAAYDAAIVVKDLVSSHPRVVDGSVSVVTLGQCTNGAPKHPLMLAYSTPVTFISKRIAP